MFRRVTGALPTFNDRSTRTTIKLNFVKLNFVSGGVHSVGKLRPHDRRKEHLKDIARTSNGGKNVKGNTSEI